MPFSDDEQIVVEEKPKLKTAILIVSFGLFAISLFNSSYCTNITCRTSFESFLLGWLAILTDGAAISWLANPFLFITWILMTKNKSYAWIFGLTATMFSLSFLAFKTIVDNEAGLSNSITKIGVGYWLWLSSCVTTFIGGFVFRKLKYK